MRGTVPKEQLQYDPEIERTARRNNSKAKRRKRQAKQASQEGTSTFIPSLTTIYEDPMTEPGNNSVMPSWTSPRRLAHLGKEKEKQMEMKPGTIQLITSHPFAGLDHEDPYQHLTVFYSLAGTIGASEADEEAIFLRLFPHSLIGKAREWYLDQTQQVMTDWNELEKAFQERFFPDNKHMDAKTAIAMFSQGASESLCEAWERYKSLLRKCPKHGFDDMTQIHMFRGGLQPDQKLILDATAGGSLMGLSPQEAVDKINKMALNDRSANHNRSVSQRKTGVLELGSNDANLAQNKILTQQLEEMKIQMKEMPKLIKEQLQKESRHQQVNFCELCTGDHPTGYCPLPLEEEVNFIGNQQRPMQYQGQYPGTSNQGRYPGNNNYQRGNNYQQPLRPTAGPSNQQPFNNFQQNPPQQDRTQKLEDTLNQFMQVSLANQQNTNASIKNLETQMGQMAQQMANQQGGTFTTNTQANPKNEQCKAVTTRSGKVIGQGIGDNLEVEKEVVEDVEEEVEEGSEKEVEDVNNEEYVNKEGEVEKNEKNKKMKKKKMKF
jgi:hypothetical protein